MDQWPPASATTPTRNPASVMTQSPTSTPWAVPLLTVSILEGAAITEKAESLVDYITEFDALKAENEELKLRIAEMEAEVRQAKADRDENVRRTAMPNLFTGRFTGPPP